MDPNVAEKIVSVTVDTMEMAEHVIQERRKRDGNEFSSETPSVMEVVAISNLIVNMSAAGMYRDQKPAEQLPSWKDLNAMIESKVDLAIAKRRLGSAPPRPSEVKEDPIRPPGSS